jgi:hypothetical protein
MPRTYTLAFEGAAIAAASGDYDLFSFLAAANTTLELIEFTLGQYTELGDAAEEQLRLRVVRGHTTAPSGGNSATARPVSPLDSAFSGTVRTVDPTIASAGTAIDLLNDTMNVRAGYPWGPRPQGAGYWVNGSAYLNIRLQAAVADDLSLNGTATFIEYP